MINEISDAIIKRAEGLIIFKSVESSIVAKSLKKPPSVTVILAYDKEVTDGQKDTRELGWDLVMMIPALAVGRGKNLTGDCIDGIRDGFNEWLPWDTGGVMPARVPSIKLEGILNTIQVYTARVTMKVMPKIIANQG
jgi:hypothetical protein